MSADITTLGMAVDSSGVRRATDDLDKMAPAGQKAAVSTTEFEKSMRRASTEGTILGQVIGQAIVQVGRLAAQFVTLGLQVGHYQDIAEKTGSGDPAGIASLRTDADVAGVSIDSVGLALNRMTLQLSRANDESKPAAKALQAIGIEVEKFKRLAPEQQYREIARALDKYTDSQDKSVVLQALIGRGGAEQLVLMKELAKNIEPVVRLTNEQIRAADDLNDSLTRDRSTLKQLTEFMALGTLPALEAVTTALKDATLEALGFDKKTKELDNSAVQEFAFGVARAFAFMADSVRGSTAFVLTAANMLGAGVSLWKEFFSTGGMTPEGKDQGLANMKAIGDSLRDELHKIWGDAANTMQVRVEDQIDKIKARMARAMEPPTTGDFARLDRMQRLDASGINTPDKKEKTSRARKEQSDALDQWFKEFMRAQERELQERARAAELIRDANRSAIDDLAKLTDAASKSADAAEQQANEFGKTREELEALDIETLRAIALDLRHVAAIEESNDANSIAVSLMRERAEALDREAAARERRAAAEKRYVEDAYGGAMRGIKAYVDEYKKGAQEAEQVSYDILRNTEYALVGTLRGNKDAARQLVDYIINEFIRLRAIKPLMAEVFGNNSGGVGYWLTQLVGFIAGGSSGVNGPSEGGSRQALQTMAPAASGRASAARAPIVVHQTNYNTIDAASDQARVSQMIEKGVARGNQSLVENLRAQGVV